MDAAYSWHVRPALAFLFLSLMHGAHTAAGAEVRVNQVGFLPAEAKEAFLLSAEPQAGASFSVLDATGTVALSAPVGQDLGAWSPAYGHVYKLDFSAVKTAGSYHVQVDGPAPG